MHKAEPIAACEAVRPGLSRVAEGEAAPREAMAAARHAMECTACKILLARERRLVEMLENDLPEVEVEDRFVAQVMARLPQGPPPRRRRRGLKIAGLAAFAGLLLSSVGGHWKLLPGPGSEPLLPTITPETVEGTLRGLDLLHGMVRLMLMALDTVARVPQGLPSLSLSVTALAVLLAASVAAVVAGSTLFAVGAGTLIRLDRQSG